MLIRCWAVRTSNVSGAYAVIVGLELVGDKSYESLFLKVSCIFPCVQCYQFAQISAVTCVKDKRS